MKSNGFVFMPVIIIIVAMLVGSAAFLITKKKDSPIEQAAEAVLRNHGIDIDFSREE